VHAREAAPARTPHVEAMGLSNGRTCNSQSTAAGPRTHVVLLCARVYQIATLRNRLVVV
jgi:hypothetical protein